MDRIESTALLLLRALPSNGRCLQSHRLATGLYATIFYLKMSWRFFSYSLLQHVVLQLFHIPYDLDIILIFVNCPYNSQNFLGYQQKSSAILVLNNKRNFLIKICIIWICMQENWSSREMYVLHNISGAFRLLLPLDFQFTCANFWCFLTKCVWSPNGRWTAAKSS
jgi:hypothetical protein